VAKARYILERLLYPLSVSKYRDVVRNPDKLRHLVPARRASGPE
jgi:hypothetical protein